MGVATYQVTVGTTAVQFRPDLTRPIPPAANLLVSNRGDVAVFVGTSGVTPSTGFRMDPSENMSFPVGSASDKLYGVTASGSSVCHVMQADSYL